MNPDPIPTDARPDDAPSGETPYQRIFRRNRGWVATVTRDDPTFFARRAGAQHPCFLFVGCSDSRVPAELLTGAAPGELFVHRNVANLVVHSDLNLLSVLHYAVDVLQVEAVVVCGHYGCGGVRAAMEAPVHGLVDHWLDRVRDVMRLHEDALAAIPDPEARYRRLVELNAAEQAYALQRTPIVQAAWARGQSLSVHAMVYDLADGIVHDLGASSHGADDDGALRDAHDSAWLQEFEQRRRAAAEGARADAIAHAGAPGDDGGA
jgi:carbonic anhydrase